MGAAVNARYQVSIASVGGELRTEREQMVRSVVALGHMPIDLVATGVLDRESPEAIDRHLGRSDYFVVIVERGDAKPTSDLERIERALAYAADKGVPVLGIGAGDSDEEAVGLDDETAELPLLERLVERIRSASKSMFVSYNQVAESALWVLIKMIEAFPRPGWVPTSELPRGDVASELVRLAKENAQLQAELHPEGEDDSKDRTLDIRLALEGNKILIPIWERANSTWETPVELDLYDFFVRLAPELVVETSVAEAAEFIPTGVCEMEPIEHTRWVVPHRSVNLWLTDLMSLGLATPSTRKHGAKDQGQYWTLSQKGKEFFSEVRRKVLETGGHRHVGFTQEFRIFTPGSEGSS